MNLKNELKEKLKSLKFESEKIKKYANFYIFKLEELEKGQVGYSIDKNGNSLIDDKEGSWKHEWIVIGHETLYKDPIVIDTKEDKYTVLSLMHGMGDWSGGTYRSESIDFFIKQIKTVSSFISEKENQNTNPRITCKELDNIISNVINEDIYGDIDEWRSLLEPIYVSTQKYEESLTKKVAKLSKQGMKVSEISMILKMSIDSINLYLNENREN